MKKINILIIAGKLDSKFESKIIPLQNLESIEKIYVAGRGKIEGKKIISAFHNGIKSNNPYLTEFIRIFLIFKLLATKRVDYIMGIYFFPHGMLATFFSILFFKKLLLNFIGEDFRDVVAHPVYKHSLKIANSVIVRGNYSKNHLLSIGIPENKVFAIPNYFDFDKVIKCDVIEKEYDLLYIGNLTPIKRVDILIKAIGIVRDKGISEIKVAILGDGFLKNELEMLVDKLDLKQNVIFLGYLKNIYEYLQKSKAFIMTSEYEGMSMAMVEALACGVPVIMPRVSNIPDYAIDGYNALLVEPLDIERFADAILQMMTIEVLYQELKFGAENFREEHEFEFSMENITSIWNNIFKQLG